jgi:hypothetical protein
MTREITIKKASPSEEEPDLFRSSKCNTLSYKSAVSTTTVAILIENIIIADPLLRGKDASNVEALAESEALFWKLLLSSGCRIWIPGANNRLMEFNGFSIDRLFECFNAIPLGAIKEEYTHAFEKDNVVCVTEPIHWHQKILSKQFESCDFYQHCFGAKPCIDPNIIHSCISNGLEIVPKMHEDSPFAKFLKARVCEIKIKLYSTDLTDDAILTKIASLKEYDTFSVTIDSEDFVDDADDDADLDDAVVTKFTHKLHILFQSIQDGHSNITSLRLDQNDYRLIVDEALVTIAADCPHLTSISLSLDYHYYYISDKGVAALARYCPYLVSIGLGGSSTTDNGLTALARGCQHLMSISLKELEEITDNGLTSLARYCPHLTSIN